MAALSGMARRSRIVIVSLGLLASGGVVGGFAGAIIGFVVAVAMNHEPTTRLDVTLGAEFGLQVGAIYGMALFPLAGWLLMRRVPLGRALLGTAVGTVGGGVVGWFLHVGRDGFLRVLVASIVGFLIAVLVLRRSTGRARVETDASAA